MAEVVIKLVEDGSALELTLTNTGDIDLFAAVDWYYSGHELILKDASGDPLVPLAMERRRIPGTDEFHPGGGSVFRFTLAPGQSRDALLPLSAIFPFEPGREYSLQATRWVHRRNDMPVEWSQDEHGVATGQGYDHHVIISNTLHFETADSSP